MNQLSQSPTLQIPFLLDQKTPNPPSKDKRRLFLSELLPSEENPTENTFLSRSIIRKYDIIKPGRLDWLYRQLLLMHFDKVIAQRVLREHAGMLDYSYTREELLNQAIDYYQKIDEEATKPVIIEGIFSNMSSEEEKDSYSMNYPAFSSLNSEIPLNHSNLSPKNELFYCTICYNESNTMISLPLCPHKYCKACVSYYIKQKIEQYDPKSIKCPNENCPQSFPEEFLLKELSSDPPLLIKYRRFKAQIEILSHPDRKWCIKPDCPHYITEPSDPLLQKAVCQCNQEQCFLCGNPWHEGETCEQAIDSDYRQYEEEIIMKKCPKCLSKIEKNEGCNHMTCTRCQHEFCWICRADCFEGFCINKCEKFSFGNLGRRPFINRNDLLFKMKREAGWSGLLKNMIKFMLNLVFFYIFSHLMVFFTFGLSLGNAFRRIFVGLDGNPSIFQLIFGLESNRQSNLSSRILNYMFFPLKIAIFLLGLTLVLLIQILKYPIFLLFNQTKYLFFCLSDLSAFCIFASIRRIELKEGNLDVLPEPRLIRLILILTTTIILFLLAYFYCYIIIFLLNI